MSASLYDFSANRLDGAPESLASYRGQVILVVNTASECGFTPQYAGLQSLYAQYKDKGFVVLGFPCNQFGGQEPGDKNQIGAFCEKNYGVAFPMFAKVDVNGDGTHPLYHYLKSSAKGLLGTEAIKWNFTKFLVGRDGQVIDRFAPTTKPEELAKHIEAVL
ncbi:glutathione peroxidase [Chitinimonas sp. BJB300]|uniref:glutathione peroxidase n=1 Tax=Chitinimonas sp. BJB300 TaxID=1559339 RepID=UPI000C0CC830|nr:glutathione peroxidase [Chitinimonas sp. BJB300]PHV10817.1 glutathione peroxidase [Chitinimonas sp. BJB300]TSJ87820.1 glutathione peroxidase [Chitinimonas sp. BJB300]